MKNVLGLFGFFVFRVWEALGETLKLHDGLEYE